MTLSPQRNLISTWNYTSARYDFEPVPEPTLFLLTAGGALWLARRRRACP